MALHAAAPGRRGVRIRSKAARTWVRPLRLMCPHSELLLGQPSPAWTPPSVRWRSTPADGPLRSATTNTSSLAAGSGSLGTLPIPGLVGARAGFQGPSPMRSPCAKPRASASSRGRRGGRPARHSAARHLGSSSSSARPSGVRLRPATGPPRVNRQVAPPRGWTAGCITETRSTFPAPNATASCALRPSYQHVFGDDPRFVGRNGS